MLAPRPHNQPLSCPICSDMLTHIYCSSCYVGYFLVLSKIIYSFGNIAHYDIFVPHLIKLVVGSTVRGEI